MTLSADGKRAYIADPGGEHADPRRQRDPGAQGEPAGARGQPADLEVGLDPPERAPVHARRQALRARVRRVHPGHDRRAATRTRSAPGGSSTSPTSARRASSPTSASRSTSPPSTRRRAATRARCSPVQGYAAHYCSLSSEVDPTVVACSFITSGLRVFDISDLLHPKEIAYYVAPTPAAGGERVHGQRLRHVQARDRALAARGLVHRRRHRLQRAARGGGRLARRLRRGRRRHGTAARGCLSRNAPIGRQGHRPGPPRA